MRIFCDDGVGMKLKLLSIGVLMVIGNVAYAVEDTPPTVYQPNYVYGETPAGAYVGDPYSPVDDGMFLPNGEPMHEYNPQSGVPEQQFQYIQGQEELMRGHSQEALQQYNQEQQIGNNMVNQYHTQIDSQTHESAPKAIVLPTM